jgi:hypothetical protein
VKFAVGQKRQLMVDYLLNLIILMVTGTIID